ncbi:hypothetical protein [Bacillus paramycoides]|uniref:Uncharacterized protein n=1 Tax=Bacillus paramycoides TaxID=2026194 RepID=A0ABU6MRH3_9BACI|nr:hypothetical protein [Bacillus paramycoides]
MFVKSIRGERYAIQYKIQKSHLLRFYKRYYNINPDSETVSFIHDDISSVYDKFSLDSKTISSVYDKFSPDSETISFIYDDISSVYGKFSLDSEMTSFIYDDISSD